MFDDVSAEHWANGYINLAVSQGIIEGDGDGNFRPNAPISYAEAMTIMVRATGYTVSAEENGGYPHGYMKTGTSNGLAKRMFKAHIQTKFQEVTLHTLQQTHLNQN